MDAENNNFGKNNSPSPPPGYVTDMEKVVQTLTLRAMAAGNNGDFQTAFLNMELGLWLAQSLEKKCLEAVLLNNLGLIHTLKGSWDRAMLFFDSAMAMAIESCPSNDRFLATIRRNISCLFDPKIAAPKGPNDESI